MTRALFSLFCRWGMVIMLSLFLGGHHTLGWADETTLDTLNQLERQVFGVIVSPADDEASRVARLEETVFGQLSSEPMAQRISRLREAVPVESSAISRPPTATSLAEPKASPNFQPPDQPAFQPDRVPPGQANANPNLDANALSHQPTGFYDDPDSPAPSENPAFTNPPNASYFGSSPEDADMAAALTNLEQKLFGQTYPMESIESRLSRLEIKLFHQPAPQGTTIAQRFERLVAVAATDKQLNEPSAIGGGGFWGTALPVIIMLLPLLL